MLQLLLSPPPPRPQGMIGHQGVVSKLGDSRLASKTRRGRPAARLIFLVSTAESIGLEAQHWLRWSLPCPGLPGTVRDRVGDREHQPWTKEDQTWLTLWSPPQIAEGVLIHLQLAMWLVLHGDVGQGVGSSRVGWGLLDQQNLYMCCRYSALSCLSPCLAVCLILSVCLYVCLPLCPSFWSYRINCNRQTSVCLPELVIGNWSKVGIRNWQPEVHLTQSVIRNRLLPNQQKAHLCKPPSFSCCKSANSPSSNFTVITICQSLMLTLNHKCPCYCTQRWGRTTFFGVRNRNSAPWRTSAIAIPQLLKECCSATVTPQFRNRNFFWSPQLESFTSAISGIFLAPE